MKVCKTNGGRLANDYSPEQRKKLFYSVCILVRFSIGLFLFFSLQISKKLKINENFAKKTLSILTFLISIYVLYLNNIVKYNGDCVWWNRTVHSLIAIVILICSVFVYFEKLDIKILGILIWFDVSFGILTSFYKKPFNN